MILKLNTIIISKMEKIGTSEVYIVYFNHSPLSKKSYALLRNVPDREGGGAGGT